MISIKCGYAEYASGINQGEIYRYLFNKFGTTYIYIHGYIVRINFSVD